MPFKAGSIYGDAYLNTTGWNNGLSKMVTTMKTSALILGAAFVAIMGKSIAKANEFQKSMSNVATLIDTTKVSTQQLTYQILNMNPALGNATELTDALYQSFSSGAQTANEAMNIVHDSAMFAVAGLTDTTTAVDVLTTAVNAYGKEVYDTKTASDIFFTAIKEGKLTGESLASSIGTSIPLFASMGVSLEDLSASLAAMTKQGVSANVATTQLNAIMNSFLKPTAELTDAFQALGYETGAAFVEAEGLSGVLELLENTAQGDADVMAKLVPNIRALRGVMTLTGQGGEEFNRILDEMENSAGATEEAFDKQEKTFTTFTNTLDNAQIVLGNIGKYFIDDIAKGATIATNSFLQFIMSSKGMEVVANIAGYVAGGFEVMKVAAQPIIDSIGPSVERIWDSLISLGDDLGTTTGEGAGAFKILAIAVQATALRITLVSQGISGLMKLIGNVIDLGKSLINQKTIFEFADEYIKEHADATGEEIQRAYLEYKETAEGSGKDIAESLETLFSDTGGSIVDMINTAMGAFDILGEGSDDLANDMKATFEIAFENTSNMIKINWGEILTGQEDFVGDFEANMEELLQILSGVTEDIVSDSDEKGEELEWTWQDTFNTIMDAANQFSSGLFSIFSQLYTNQLSELRNDLAQEKQLIEQRYADGLISQEEYEEQLLQLDEDYAKKMNKVAEKQFRMEKANKITGVWMDAGSAIAGWWQGAAHFPSVIAGIAMAASMTAATIAMASAQTALISRQEFIKPYFKGGKPTTPFQEIGEHGGEIVSLPNNATIIPNDISRQIASNSGNVRNQYLSVSFAGANINDNVSMKKIVKEVSKQLGKTLRLAG